VPRDIKGAVTDALEVELDQLFQRPLSGLVEARDALVARLRKAGDKAAAAKVKALRRPTPAAWALNQVHFARPELVAQARTASDEVRALHAQDGVDPRALSAALTAQRAALHEVVESALLHCEAAGVPSGAAHQRKLLATLQGVLSGVSEERPGRLTRDLEPAGFDAIAVVGTPGTPGPGLAVPKPGPSLIKATLSSDSEQAAARALVRERELSAHEAQKRAQQARNELTNAEREQEAAEARVRAAEATLASLQARLVTREEESSRLRAALDEALSLASAARSALSQAQKDVLGE
jgi:hypothetical protein